MTPGGLHVLLADEADQMTNAGATGITLQARCHRSRAAHHLDFHSERHRAIGAKVPFPLQDAGFLRLRYVQRHRLLDIGGDNALTSVKSKNFLDFFEHPLPLTALFALGGLVGTLIYTPFYVL